MRDRTIRHCVFLARLVVHHVLLISYTIYDMGDYTEAAILGDRMR